MGRAGHGMSADPAVGGEAPTPTRAEPVTENAAALHWWLKLQTPGNKFQCQSPEWLFEVGCPKCYDPARRWEVTSDCWVYCMACSWGCSTAYPFTPAGKTTAILEPPALRPPQAETATLDGKAVRRIWNAAYNEAVRGHGGAIYASDAAWAAVDAALRVSPPATPDAARCAMALSAMAEILRVNLKPWEPARQIATLNQAAALLESLSLEVEALRPLSAAPPPGEPGASPDTASNLIVDALMRLQGVDTMPGTVQDAMNERLLGEAETCLRDALVALRSPSAPPPEEPARDCIACSVERENGNSVDADLHSCDRRIPAVVESARRAINRQLQTLADLALRASPTARATDARDEAFLISLVPELLAFAGYNSPGSTHEATFGWGGVRRNQNPRCGLLRLLGAVRREGPLRYRVTRWLPHPDGRTHRVQGFHALRLYRLGLRKLRARRRSPSPHPDDGRGEGGDRCVSSGCVNAQTWCRRCWGRWSFPALRLVIRRSGSTTTPQ